MHLRIVVAALFLLTTIAGSFAAFFGAGDA